MPVYVYQVILPDGQPDEGEVFEVLQSIHDSPLEVHPETGQPVQRLMTAPKLSGRWSDTKMDLSLSDKNLAAKGFTKYVKTDEGSYEKTVGDGPSNLSADPT